VPFWREGRQLPCVGDLAFTMKVLLKLKERAKNGKVQYACKCACGAFMVVRSDALKKIQGCHSCAGKRNAPYTHGKSKTPEYKAWRSMLDRCTSKNNKMYRHYGGRGIKVHKRWWLFENFYADMGDRPTPLHMLDRVDNDKGYEPANCAWRLNKEQQRNKRNNKILVLDGEGKTLAEWVEITGIAGTTIHNRLRRGWSTERALTESPQIQRRR